MKFLLSALLSLIVSSAALTAQAEDYKAYQKKVNNINFMGDYSVLTYAHKYMLHSPYIIVDKSKKVLYTYSQQAQPEEVRSITVFDGDELEAGGSGIYTYAGLQDGVHYGRAESDGSLHALFKGELPLDVVGTPVYVIPTSANHRFRIRNYKLTYNSARVQRNRPGMNYSPIDMTYYPSNYSTDLADDFTKVYVETLQDEKEKLMTLLGLENDEYNMLAEFAFGVLSVETDYGRNILYRVKNKVPYVISVIKGNGLDTTYNSRGPTQIKIIPGSVEKVYGLTKSNIAKPRNAAIATLAFGAETLTELRNYAKDFAPLNEENLLDYIYYVYNGRRYELKDGTATPKENIAIRKLFQAVEHFHIDEVSN